MSAEDKTICDRWEKDGMFFTGFSSIRGNKTKRWRVIALNSPREYRFRGVPADMACFATFFEGTCFAEFPAPK